MVTTSCSLCQPNFSCSLTTSPTMINTGAAIFASLESWAMVASDPVSVRCSGVVPLEISAVRKFCD